MKPQNKILRPLGSILFFAGVLLGMALSGGLIWANLEAKFYFGYNGGAETTLRLTCPHILTAHETGSVTATVTNKVERAISPIFQADISGPMMHSIRTQPSIGPGKTLKVQWEIGPADVDYGHLILVQVYQNASFKTSSATATCGTLFLTLPNLTGMQVYILTLVGSLLGIAGGLALWVFSSQPFKEQTSREMWGMILLSVVVMAGILFGSLEYWGPGVLALVLALLMMVVLVGRRITPL